MGLLMIAFHWRPEWQVVNAVARSTARAGASMVSVVLDLETLQAGNQAILQRFGSVLKQYGNRLRLAIIDHVTSAPTYHMPLKELAEMCRSYAVSGELPTLNPKLPCHPMNTVATVAESFESLWGNGRLAHMLNSMQSCDTTKHVLIIADCLVL